MKKKLFLILLWVAGLAALCACMAAGARSRTSPQDPPAGPASEPGSGTTAPVVILPPISSEPPCSDTLPTEPTEAETETESAEAPCSDTLPTEPTEAETETESAEAPVVLPSVPTEPPCSDPLPAATTEPVTPPEETTETETVPTEEPETEAPLPTLPGSTAAGWDPARAEGFPADAACTPAQFLEKWLTVEGLSLSDLDARGCRQLVLTAAQPDGVTALTTCYEKGADGVWYHMGSLLEMPGWVGAKGIAHDRRRYTDTSPAGLWGLGTAFGNGEKPAGLLLPWRDVTPRSDWVCDAGSPYFNTWQERSASAQDDDRDYDEAEHLADYPNQYAWACVIAYNLPPDPIPERGCAIFLHCAKGPTEGCVGLPAPELLRTLLWLDPAKHPYILISGTERGQG